MDGTTLAKSTCFINKKKKKKKSGQKLSMKHRVLTSHRSKTGLMQYAIIKTMCPPGYHHIGSVVTHALGHMMYNYTLLVPMN